MITIHHPSLVQCYCDRDNAFCYIIASTTQHLLQMITWKKVTYDGCDKSTKAGFEDDEAIATGETLRSLLRWRRSFQMTLLSHRHLQYRPLRNINCGLVVGLSLSLCRVATMYGLNKRFTCLSIYRSVNYMPY